MNEKIPLAKKNETILVVDDEDCIWDFVIEALQNLGYIVLLAGDGEEAVDIYKNNPGEIDLVFLDMVMPRVGGHSAFFQIRSINPKAKVLLSSGYVAEKEIEDLLEQGAQGFLHKPHRIKTLAVEIRRILDKTI